MEPGDCRSRRILVVGDMDDPRLAGLSGPGGYGLIQTPPEGMAPALALDALALVADQIEDFLRHGYSVHLSGSAACWSDALEQLLSARGILLPEALAEAEPPTRR
jgi:hypothetical protein